MIRYLEVVSFRVEIHGAEGMPVIAWDPMLTF